MEARWRCNSFESTRVFWWLWRCLAQCLGSRHLHLPLCPAQMANMNQQHLCFDTRPLPPSSRRLERCYRRQTHSRNCEYLDTQSRNRGYLERGIMRLELLFAPAVVKFPPPLRLIGRMQVLQWTHITHRRRVASNPGPSRVPLMAAITQIPSTFGTIILLFRTSFI